MGKVTNIGRKNKIKIVLAILISMILAGVTEMYLVKLGHLGLQEGIISLFKNYFNLTHFVIFFLVYLGIGIAFHQKGKIIGEYAYRFRYLIAGIIFIVCVFFEISGSSIGMWGYCIGSDLTSNGDLVGTARAIRGDEWVVNTPFAVSQEQNQTGKYPYYSDTIRGDKTDIFIVYGQPCYDISMIFKPFQLGYLLFGSAKGLAFFWCGRFIALFLVMFELGMLLTKKNKGISLILALLTTFAPAVQWWFAVNGLIEMIVFGGLAILLLNQYLKTNHFGKRFLYTCLMAICAGGYILVFYPAWQVPMVFVFLGLAIWIILQNHKENKIQIKIRDVLTILFVVILTGILMANILNKSMSTIQSVMNTAYPGARLETGGEMGSKYFQYPSNLFFTISDQNLGTNVCEAAVFWDFFPMGLILATIVLIKQKQKDSLSMILLILSAIFGIWCTIGFPEFLAKISLLYVSPAQRTFVVAGFVNLLLLVRSLALLKNAPSRISSGVCAVILTILATSICMNSFPDYYGMGKIGITMAILFTLYYSLFRYQTEKGKKAFLSFITLTLLFMSVLINPIHKGIDVISKQPVGQAIQEVNQKQNGLWMVEGTGYPLFNFPIMYGAATINSTNVYPNLERWRKLDPDGKNEEIYNRYAHIVINLVKTGEPEFKLLYPDSFSLTLPVDRLKDLEVDYIFTVNDLKEVETNQIHFEKLYDNYGIKLYQVKEQK